MMGTRTNTVLAGATSEMPGKIRALSESRAKGKHCQRTWNSWRSRERGRQGITRRASLVNTRSTPYTDTLKPGLFLPWSRAFSSWTWVQVLTPTSVLCNFGQVAKPLWAEVSCLQNAGESCKSAAPNEAYIRVMWAFGIRRLKNLWESLIWK